MQQEHEWLDVIIEQQREQRELMNLICDPYDAAELLEILEREEGY